MALPPALLQFVEQHGCFSGCYGSNSNHHAFTALAQPSQPMVTVTCEDCLMHLGVLSSLLPPGMASYKLADQLSQHVRARRGYSVSVSGYHARGPGFWFSAVYWSSCNVFLLDGERSRKLGRDIDLLILAFQHGVMSPADPAMRDPLAFAVEAVYLDPGQPLTPFAAKADLLSAPGVSLQPVAGWKKVTLAEFVGTPAIASAHPAASAKPATSASPVVGQHCPNCGAEIRVRTLLNQTFVGCLC